MLKKSAPRSASTGNFGVLAKEMRLVFLILMKHIRRDLEKRLAACGLSLSPLAFGVLHLLNQKTRTIKGLGEKMMLRPATLVPVVNNLEKRRLVKSRPDEVDRRSHILTLTPAGRKIARFLTETNVNNLLALQLKKIGEADSRQLSARLKELAAAMVGREELNKLLKQSL